MTSALANNISVVYVRGQIETQQFKMHKAEERER